MRHGLVSFGCLYHEVAIAHSSECLCSKQRYRCEFTCRHRICLCLITDPHKYSRPSANMHLSSIAIGEYFFSFVSSV